MILTLEKLFNSPQIIRAVINRVIQTTADTVVWKRYLDFEETKARLFKTYIGTVTGVVMGSVIDKNSGKPIRERRTLGSGTGEVADLGNSFQLDNERLSIIKQLTDKYNQAGAGQAAVMNEIINFLADDIRQCTLAPHKRMDYLVGQLISTGKGEVKLDDNKEGVSLIDMELPVMKFDPTSAEKTKFISYLQKVVNETRTKVGVFAAMEMTRTTFNKRVIASNEFKDTYKMVLGSAQIGVSGGIITEAMANQLLTGIGLPPIRIVEDYVVKEDGTTTNIFADERIALLPTAKLGKMMWHEPYELTDRVPNKTYTVLEGGHYITTQRTEEGRFIEYGCEWMPSFTAPQSMVVINTSNMG